MLRSVLREALAAIEARRPVPPHCAGAINTVLRSLEGYAQLMPAGKGWRLGFVARSLDPLQAMAPIAHSAAELFEKADTAPVRKCANPECVLYFYDTSRTGRRRWCSMAICGNRHKVAAFAQRRASR
ncbi:MAG: CGNR zinc finger domain-containing protein [Acidobacteria bacterium]|nr:CGNR zinc finger domain-containing protein [Acidobacteriota bacterium]